MAGTVKERIYMDGCFDVVHHGHCNAIRQAKQLGDVLVIGIHPDDEIVKHKGPPVYTHDERIKIVDAIKWVDEVYSAAPFVLTEDILDEVKCGFCAHGDDVTISAESGLDVYGELKDIGRYRAFKRTNGVSTTDIVGRILTMTRTHHENEEDQVKYSQALGEIGQGNDANSPYTGTARFLATSNKILQFSSGNEPKPNDRIVYANGTFDLLHVGNVCFLEEAAKQGDFLIIGLLSDQVVNTIKGGNYPIMNLHERILSLLACKYVSEVVIGAPIEVTVDILDHFKIDVVVHGDTTIRRLPDGRDPHAEPKRRGIFKIIQSGSKISTENIVNRVLKRRLEFEERNRKKQAREIKAIEDLMSEVK